MSDFIQAITYVLQNEGGFVDNPADPGGATKYGITGRILAAYRGTQVTSQDVSLMTLDEAEAIYKAYFWDVMHLDQFPQQIATAMMDMAVNLGQANAVRLAQKAANAAVDGVLGPKTVSAILAIDPNVWLYDVIGCLQDYYVDLNNSEFLKGWLARSRRMILLMEPVKSPQLLP